MKQAERRRGAAPRPRRPQAALERVLGAALAARPRARVVVPRRRLRCCWSGLVWVLGADRDDRRAGPRRVDRGDRRLADRRLAQAAPRAARRRRARSCCSGSCVIAVRRPDRRRARASSSQSDQLAEYAAPRRRQGAEWLRDARRRRVGAASVDRQGVAAAAPTIISTLVHGILHGIRGSRRSRSASLSRRSRSSSCSRTGRRCARGSKGTSASRSRSPGPSPAT